MSEEAQQDIRYNVVFEDGASGEQLDLMLVDGDGVLGFQRRLINPYAAKMRGGETKDSDLTERSVWSQRDWRGGRGHENAEEGDDVFYDSRGLETRIDQQLTLGPLPIAAVDSDVPEYAPGSMSWYGAGIMPPMQGIAGTSRDYSIVGGPLTSKAGQLVRPYQTFGFTLYIESIEIKVRNTGSPTEDLRVGIHADDDGKPADSELTFTTIAKEGVTSSFAWVTATLSTPYAAPSAFWIVVSTTETSAAYEMVCSETFVESRGDHENVQPLGNGLLYWTSAWGGRWKKIGDWNHKVNFAEVQRSMSFTTPAGGLTCSRVLLFFGLCSGTASGVVVRLCENNGGDPGDILQTKTVAPDFECFRWYPVVWDSSEALDGSTVYHITVEGPASDWYMVMWGGCSSGGYASGASKRKIGSGSWSAQTEDLYFRINQAEVEDAPVDFVRYGNDLFCAAGDSVYKWNESSQQWDLSEQVSGKDVTDLEVWGGKLWAARGNDANIRKYAGSWADGGRKGTYLKGGIGYLHLSGAGSDDDQVYYTSNETDWAAIENGPLPDSVTAMEWWRDQLMVTTSRQMWGIAAMLFYRVADWSSQEDADNGRGMITWMRTGALYIPLRFGLYRWNGDTSGAVGPEQGMGLPGDRAGKIAALVGTNNWLFAAIDAGTGGTSSVLAYNGLGGWHELARAEESGQRIRALAFETIHSPSRLWYGMDTQTRYLQLPDTADNPWQWTGFEFNASGEIELSWVGGELLEVVKDLHELVVRGEGFASGQIVDVFYEVDRCGRWTYLGRVDEGPRFLLRFPASSFENKETGSGCTRTTIELDSGYDTTDMRPGDFVRIGGEVAQVASITDSDTFVLETALRFVPNSGEGIYPSKPAGREFRFKLVLTTDDNTATPKVTAVVLRYQANVLDRFSFQLQVPIIQGIKSVSGTELKWRAADLRAELDRWAKRVAAFTLYDPDGNPWTVKVVSAGEGGYQLVQNNSGTVVYRSVYSLNLVEV